MRNASYVLFLIVCECTRIYSSNGNSAHNFLDIRSNTIPRRDFRRGKDGYDSGKISSHNGKLQEIRGGSVPKSLTEVLDGGNSYDAPSDPSTIANFNADISSSLVHTSAHWMSARDCLDALQVNEAHGLSSGEAYRRITQVYGMNTLPAPAGKSWLSVFREQFDDKLVQVLLGVAALSAGFALAENDPHGLAEPAIILTILLLNAFVGLWQIMCADDSVAALKKLQPETATVLRDGQWNANFPAISIVPGDIIYLRVGDRVPADGRILSLKTATFSTDEGSLTGESATVMKAVEAVDVTASISGKLDMVFSGTVVTNGGCYVLVTNTGAVTEIGAINAGVQAAKEEQVKTPLAIQLDEFGIQLTKIIGSICVVVWLASIPQFGNEIFGSWMRGAVYHAKIAVALGVAAIPEGLPAVITLCLSLGTRRMAKRNVIVRNLSSVETLGCTSVICTDKTGTLTTNKMTVKQLVTISRATDEEVNFVDRRVEGVSFEPVGEVEGWDDQSMGGQETFMNLAAICSICNEARIEYLAADELYDRVGEPTEAALKVLVEKLRINALPLAFAHSSDPVRMASQYSDSWHSRFEVLSFLEFNRDRKSMGVLARPRQTESGSNVLKQKNDNVLFVKGASEMVISRCNRMQLEDGSVVPISSSMHEVLVTKCRQMSGVPLRCVAIAYKPGKELHPELRDAATPYAASRSALIQDPRNYVDIERDMILVGICGIKDPARPEAAAAIDKCTAAGRRQGAGCRV